MLHMRDLRAFLHALRLVNEDDRVLRQVILQVGVVVEQRHEQLRARRCAACGKRFQLFGKARFLFERAHAPRTRLFRERHFACGRENDRFDVFDGALRQRIIGAHGIDLIVKEFDAHRVFRGDREHVKVATAQANLPPRLADLHALIARADQLPEQRLRFHRFPRMHFHRHAAEYARWCKALQKRRRGNRNKSIFAGKQAGKRLDAARRKAGRGRKAAPRKRHIPCGQVNGIWDVGCRFLSDARGRSFVCRNKEHGFPRISKKRSGHMCAVRFTEAEHRRGAFVFYESFPEPPVFRMLPEKLYERMLIHALLPGAARLPA